MKKIILSILLLGTSLLSGKEVPNFYSMSPEEGLMDALIHYNVHHEEIVYAQAILETGYFKSKGCTVDNNLFGLRKSSGKYYKYGHWVKSVIAYRNKIQSKYKIGEDYFHFLNRIHYAEDPNYTKLVKIISESAYCKSKRIDN